jgi:hypothetical protein
MHLKSTIRCASAISLALIFATANAAGEDSASSNTKPMTGKQKATAIGVTTGAVAGAVVGGPVGAVAGAVVGGVVGNQGTDANGKVPSNGKVSSTSMSANTVRSAQDALNGQGYSAGAADGQWGPNTLSAVRRFQADKGLAPSGTLDSATLAALGVSG